MSKIDSELSKSTKYPIIIENNIPYLNAKYVKRSSLKELAEDLHTYRRAGDEDILSCAHALDVDYHWIEELERGACKKINLDLLMRLIIRYNEKLILGLGEANVR